HFIGKDILTTHTVYWWSMLMALGVPVPKRVFAHGWWLMGDAKMSKSAGNVVDPLALKDRYGVEVFRFFLLREMVLGQDASFSEAGLILRNNSELADDLGNLVNRVLNLVEKRFDGAVPTCGALLGEDVTLVGDAEALTSRVQELTGALELHKAIDAIITYVRRLNKYVNDTKPFTVVKTDEARAATTLWVVLNGVATVARLLSPVMPKTMADLLTRIGAGSGALVVGTPVVKGEPLFPKYEVPVPITEPVPSPAAPVAPPAPVVAAAPPATEFLPEPFLPEIEFGDFAKIDLRVALVVEAERVPKSDKLLKLQVDLGGTRRQIVAGIGLTYTPEALVGQHLVVVANLKPRKLFGLESQGMVLAGKSGAVLSVIRPVTDVAAGGSVS
ncbi:MAG: methionine--tRNA ligase subunit beta, partial [Myxococcales bacterium]|nr:methionine--tRNA ligase subunit beta [Myxococcales bacterium]